MKRLGLTLVAAVCLTATTFAAGNQPTTAKWDGNINVSKLSKYLNLSADQNEEVANICEYFGTQMERVSSSKKNQDELLHNAVYGNLKLMKKTLSDKLKSVLSISADIKLMEPNSISRSEGKSKHVIDKRVLK